MSKFFKALEQAKRDAALRRSAALTADRPPDPAPAGPPRPPAAFAVPLPADTDEGIDERLVSLVAPAAFEAEQYRALRHAVEQLHRTAGIKVVAVSSPGGGDGKTLTAVNLAGALAQAIEARVLVVDADLRRPCLAQVLALKDPRGADLVNAILDPDLGLDDIVQACPPFNLSVMGVGEVPSSPYELLKSPRLGELFEEARARFDYVIVDTPPLTPMQDCRVIGRWVDGFLLVVRSRRTPRRLVGEALTALDRTKVLGIVFNHEERRAANLYTRYSTPDSASGHASARARRVWHQVVGTVVGRLGGRTRASGHAAASRHGGS